MKRKLSASSGTRALTGRCHVKSVQVSERRAAETLVFSQCMSVRLPRWAFWKIANDGIDRRTLSTIRSVHQDKTRTRC